jgi:secreted trypsin-like serine protease
MPAGLALEDKQVATTRKRILLSRSGLAQKRVWQRRAIAVLAAILIVLAASVQTASGIVYGEFDGNRHPNVGAFVIQQDGEFRRVCSGTLIAPDVFLTASHCTAAVASLGIPADEVWVTFDPVFDQGSELIPGTAHTHPEFGFSGPGGVSDPHDIAVIVLDSAVGIEPAQLPEQGLLDRLKGAHALDDQVFTAVGYGTVRETRKGGPGAILENTERRFALQSALSLQKAWLTLSMNQATGDGGTCFGDSGGPHFLGGETSNLVVSITVTGDTVCKATDKTYRIDTPSARDFLDDFVDVP